MCQSLRFLMCQKTSFFECVKILWIFNVSTFGRIIKETGGLRSAVCGLRSAVCGRNGSNDGRNAAGFASVRRLSRLRRTPRTRGV
jgi:hypothetical protein